MRALLIAINDNWHSFVILGVILAYMGPMGPLKRSGEDRVAILITIREVNNRERRAPRYRKIVSNYCTV